MVVIVVIGRHAQAALRIMPRFAVFLDRMSERPQATAAVTLGDLLAGVDDGQLRAATTERSRLVKAMLWFRLSAPEAITPCVRSAREQHRVEQGAERAERLAAPLRSESEEHDVPGIEADVERRRLPVQVLFADEVARQQR
ncbi:MAG: hypothetical protein JWL71_3947 [Acidobacteria bacterium]|nr:hypothetical protein [Acidobacteriota bacterium]